MPLPRCPSCGGAIFPSALDGDESFPVCDRCRGELEAVRVEEGRGLGLFPPSTGPAEVVVEPSGPFALPDAPAPRDLLDDIGVLRKAAQLAQDVSREAASTPGREEEVVLEPSGPFHLPSERPTEEKVVLEPSGPFHLPSADDLAAGEDGGADEDVLEPSGPFHLPPPAARPESASPFFATPPPDGSGLSPDTPLPEPVVLLDVTGPFLHQGKDKVQSGTVKVSRRGGVAVDAGTPSVVVDPRAVGASALADGGPSSAEPPKRNGAGGAEQPDDAVVLPLPGRTRLDTWAAPAPTTRTASGGGSWLSVAVAFVVGIVVGFLLAFSMYGCDCGADVTPVGGDGDDGGADGDSDADTDADTDVDADSDGDADCLGLVCQDDRHCVDGDCVPWGEGQFDPGCTRDAPGGKLRPELQCAWEGPPEDDSLPGASHVLHTPLVVNLHLAEDPDAVDRPAIVFAGDDSYTEGVARVCTAASALRIIDGSSCAERFSITDPADRVNGSVTPAIADLDGAGPPEIVAAASAGGLLAFTWEEGSRAFVRMWQSTEADGSLSTLGSETCLWGGVSVHDLDDDSSPEVLFHGAVHDAGGRVLGRWPYTHIAWGSPPVVADADLDGVPEILEAYGTYELVDGVVALDAEWVGPGRTQGFVAVADLGDFPDVVGDAPGRAEVVLSGMGDVVVQSVAGSPIWERLGGSGGGPPTIADFDGDGRAEIGVAFGDQYTVFDLDCDGAPAGCADDGVLWAVPSQDLSSRKTGSSVFDFNGDGRAEVVYGDECFLRVYDGPTGQVLFSQGRFSSTWEENAIVADADGDFAAEIVLPASSVCNTDYCGEWDPVFPGIACDSREDCPGGPCNDGLCACASDEECGGDFACDFESGNCRTRHAGCAPGIRVYRDAHDRWASSRTIWNQHAYAVTNVDDDGFVPRSSEWERNWETDGLNNFRQNVQGELSEIPAADLTVRLGEPECGEGGVVIVAVVCNRGGASVDAGVVVEVHAGDASGQILCSAQTAGALDPGSCEEVRCTTLEASGVLPAAVVDPGETRAECREDDNSAAGDEIICLE